MPTSFLAGRNGLKKPRPSHFEQRIRSPVTPHSSVATPDSDLRPGEGGEASSREVCLLVLEVECLFKNTAGSSEDVPARGKSVFKTLANTLASNVMFFWLFFFLSSSSQTLNECTVFYSGRQAGSCEAITARVPLLCSRVSQQLDVTITLPVALQRDVKKKSISI